MQIDVGFGDAVEPAPKVLTFPVLLELDPPIINVYPPEAVVAEKFHAMVVLGIANSRMKDFFDVWTLASTYSFEMDALSRAVRSTFDRRRTEVPQVVPLALTNEFLNDTTKKAQCIAFLRRMGLTGEQPTLADIGLFLAGFLIPAASAAAGVSSPYRLWTPPGPWE
jgi:Nucleotidyl transferase AbiEii toxin, Type IV TA system